MRSTNMCSDKEEPVYCEKFNLRDGKIWGYIEAQFGAYIPCILSLNKKRKQILYIEG